MCKSDLAIKVEHEREAWLWLVYMLGALLKT